LIYSFVVEKTDENFVINTETMRWGIASSILSAPSIVAAENNMAKYEFSAEGELIPMGGDTFALDGRTEKDGLSKVTIHSIPFIDTLIVSISANVEIKDETFKSNPVKSVKYFIQNPQKVAPNVSTAEN
jgi:hypothetical protein